jgi:hypothetical protein
LNLEKRRRQIGREGINVASKEQGIVGSAGMKTQKHSGICKRQKNSNTIWHLLDSAGREVSSFEGMAQLGKAHF